MPPARKPSTRKPAARKPRAVAAAAAPPASKTPKAAPAVPEWVPKGAAAKLAFIQSQMETITKTGKHAQGWDYMQEHKLIELLRPHLRDLHCAIVVEPAAVIDVRPATVFRKEGFLTTLQGRIRFIDTDEPVDSLDREITAEVCGQGADTEDKGSGKAQTYLTKYAMQKLFLIPTEEIEDADASPAGVADVAALPIKTTAPKVLASLRAALVAARPAEGAARTEFDKKVKTKLVSMGVDTIDNLTIDQVPAFQDWVVEQTKKAA